MLGHMKKWLSKQYLLYELNTCIYMFEPWERLFINTVLFVMLCLMIASSCMYIAKYSDAVLAILMPTPKISELFVNQPQKYPILS